jgi:hypothetical protein
MTHNGASSASPAGLYRHGENAFILIMGNMGTQAAFALLDLRIISFP